MTQRSLLIGLALLALVAPALLAEEPVYARHPALSPDGSQLAFDWRGDVWVVPREGGRAQRLTAHQAHDGYPRWSPDGKSLAFMSHRHGNWDLFVMDLESLSPRRLTWHSGDDRICDWTADGKEILFASSRQNLRGGLFAVSAEGGLPRPVIGDQAENASSSPDGRWIAYQRGYTNWWRQHYRGWASGDLWVRAFEGGPSYHVVSWKGDDEHPHWGPGGRSLIFQSEREDGVANLWRQDLSFGPEGVIPSGPARQLTQLGEDGMQFLDLSRDGRWAAFEWKAGLWVVPAAGGEPFRPKISVPGDDALNAVTREWITRGATEFAWAPGEGQVAFVAQGEIYCALFEDGELHDPVRLTETDAREKDLAWLDGERLLFVSDRHGGDDIFLMKSADPDEERLGKSRKRETRRLTDDAETERAPQVSPDGETILYKRDIGYLWAMDAEGGDQRQLLDVPAVLHSSWSPDGRYIAYSVTTLGSAEDIFIHELETGRTANVSTHPRDDFHPLWTADGKRLSWASREDGDGSYQIKYLWLNWEEADKTEREREREERDAKKAHDDVEEGEEGPGVTVRIDWENFADRVVTVASLRGYYWDYDQSPDGKHYAIEAEAAEGTELWAVDWDGDNLRKLTSGGTNPDYLRWGEDNETIRYISDGRMQAVKNDEGARPETLGFRALLTLDARERRLQKLREAWRLLDDGFYDGEFHGVDWPAVLAKYEPIAEHAVMTEDFNDLVREMIGELNASHLGCWGGPFPGEGNTRSGCLGFDPDLGYEGPGLGVGFVVPRGPMDREGKRVEPGDAILAIDGKRLEKGENFWILLADKVGEEVDLELASGREITVEPASTWRIRNLRYQNWMDENRARVSELSGGRLAYLHMSAMGGGNWRQFLVDIFSKTEGAEGLVLDLRFNNGGSIHDQVLTFLSRRPYVYEKSRGDTEITYNSIRRWDGPIVLLTNERSYSDGEIFPAGFKELGLGSVVGMPTFGAVIGTSNTQLIDGTTFRIPGTGWYTLDGKNLENGPVEPDIWVPAVPEEGLAGRDAQLEAGVAECLRLLD